MIWFQRARLAITSTLAAAGYGVTQHNDIDALPGWTGGASGVVGPAFDPAYSDLNPSAFFWLAVGYTGGDPARRAACHDGLAAVIACRLFETDDFIEDICQGRVYLRDSLLTGRPADIVIPRPWPRIGRRIGHHGALYVVPGHRGQGLPIALCRLVRAITGCSSWRPDFHCGNTVMDPPPARNAVRKYGYTHQVPLIRGYCPSRDVHPAAKSAITARDLTLISRADMANQARRDASILEGNHGQNMRDVMAVLADRTEQPQVSLPLAINDARDTA